MIAALTTNGKSGLRMVQFEARGGGNGGPGGRPEPSGDGPDDRTRQLGELAGLGLMLGLATALFAWLGSLLDEWLGTAPLFVLLGTFTGFGAGFYSMYWRLVLKPDAERRERRAGDG